MVRETFEQIIEAFKVGNYKIMDITGGAPEMNPNFRWFLKEISKYAKTVMVRTNLGDVMSLSRQNRWLGAGGGGAVVREGWARGVSSAHGRPYHPVSSQALSHHHADPRQFGGLPGEKGSL